MEETTQVSDLGDDFEPQVVRFQITKLLAVRPGRRSTNTTLRIVVARSEKPNPSQCLPSMSHTRDNSYGSSSVAEDVDAAVGEGVAPSDDLLKASYYSDHSTEHGEL